MRDWTRKKGAASSKESGVIIPLSKQVFNTLKKKKRKQRSKQAELRRRRKSKLRRRKRDMRIIAQKRT